MIYDKAKQVTSSLMQGSTISSNSPVNQPVPVTINSANEEKEFYENLIDKWLMTTQVIKFSAKKLAESLSLHDSYSIVLSILDSNPSLCQISEGKYINKRNLKNFCTQLICQIKDDADTIIDILKTEFELSELIGSQYKKSIVSLVIEELETNTYDIIVIQNFGFLFPTSRFEPISKDKAKAILNAKNYLYLSKISDSNENQYISICEQFLNDCQNGNIDSDLCQMVNEIHPKIQFIPNSCSNRAFSPPPTIKSNLSQFPFSKSSSDLKDYPIVYKDIEVHIDDFKSLRGKSWLNDRIIHIYGRIIEDGHEDIKFIPPCTVQYIRFKGGKEVTSVVSSWNLSNYSMVFIPFTNSESARDPGNHWSLLVWFPKSGNRFYHCDSYQNISELSHSSLKVAMSIVKKLICLCKLKKYKFIKAAVPQQDNNYDCGLYLLAYIDFLVEKNTFEGMEEVITHEMITSMRSSIERRILNVRK